MFVSSKKGEKHVHTIRSPDYTERGSRRVRMSYRLKVLGLDFQSNSDYTRADEVTLPPSRGSVWVMSYNRQESVPKRTHNTNTEWRGHSPLSSRHSCSEHRLNATVCLREFTTYLIKQISFFLLWVFYTEMARQFCFVYNLF